MKFSDKELLRLGLQKLAQSELAAELPYAAEPSLPVQQQPPVTIIMAPPQQAPAQYVEPQEKKKVISPAVGWTRAPTASEAQELDSYSKAALLGLLGGAATGMLGGAVFPKASPIRHSLLGALAGTVGGLTRHYEQSSEPPGLSPVYTIPGGFRTGLATGGIAGGLAGHFLPFGVGAIPGAISGALSGGVGGALASQMI